MRFILVIMEKIHTLVVIKIKSQFLEGFQFRKLLRKKL